MKFVVFDKNKDIEHFQMKCHISKSNFFVSGGESDS